MLVLVGHSCALNKLWAFKAQCPHHTPEQLTQNLWPGTQAEGLTPWVIQLCGQSWEPLALPYTLGHGPR